MNTQTRTLTINLEPDLDADMAQFAALAKRGLATRQYQGEALSFATPGAFFGQLTTHRWNILTSLLDAGTVGVRELARRMGRDVKRVHEDAKALVAVGLLAKTARGALYCPYGRIDIDMALVPGSSVPRSLGKESDDDGADMLDDYADVPLTVAHARHVGHQGVALAY